MTNSWVVFRKANVDCYTKEKQYEIYRSVMLPYLKKDADLSEDEKLESKKTILQVFRDTLKNDDQLNILSKYKTPQEFAAKASQEEFNRLMQLRHIGGWVNHIIFEKKDETILKLMKMEDFNEYRDLYVRLAKAAYGFGNAVSSEVDLVGNINYAFMSEASIEKLGANEMRLKSFNCNSLDYLKNRQQMVSSEKDNYRIGENAAKRMEADAKVFEGKIELYESFTKYHKEGLYRKSNYSDVRESKELNTLLHEKFYEVEAKEPPASKHLKNREFVHTYEECRNLLEKYRTDLMKIDKLDSDILTKERIAEIGKDFEFFKSLIEDEKSGTIFAVQENLAENFWDAYYILAPVAEYAKSVDGEPSMDEILRLKKDKSLTVNREEAETRYQARQLRNKQDQLDYDYMKTYLEVLDIRDIKKAVGNQ